MKFLNKPLYIIAEVAQGHDGSLGLAHSFIEAVSKTGVDAIKFQTHIASAESTHREPWRVRFSYEDRTRYDYWERMEFTPEQWLELSEHSKQVGLDFVSSPFSTEAVDLLEKLNPPFWKVGSGEIDNIVLLDHILKTKRPIVVSTGMSNFAEIDQTYKHLKQSGNKFALLHCTSEYPVKLENFGLNVLSEFKQRYECPVGLSSHLPSLGPNLAAVALGADIIEVHVAFSRDMFGPDSTSSFTVEELKKFVEEARNVKHILENPMDKDLHSIKLKPTRDIFRKSIVAKRNLSTGSILRLEDLAFKKPGDGLPVKNYELLVGKKLRQNKLQDDTISLEDLE